MESDRRFIIDTHIFVWWMEKDNRLRKNIENIIADPQNFIFLSTVCVWELVTKKKIGRLRLPKDWKETVNSGRFEILPINLEHVLALETLPLYHKDPFDRMLIAQAQVENCRLITVDPKIKKYKVRTL